MISREKKPKFITGRDILQQKRKGHRALTGCVAKSDMIHYTASHERLLA